MARIQRRRAVTLDPDEPADCEWRISNDSFNL